MMLVAFVYLTAAVICVPLARRLGLGSILGYLIAGAAIGPWGLHFVDDVDTILNFAEFGVVLMLFVIGLELETERLWAMRTAVFGGGTLQLVLSGAALAAGGLALGLPWRGALVAGLAIALSSTAIAMQTMGERNLTPTPMGRMAFAVLLFQDVAAIPLLAAVPLLGATMAGGAEPSWRDAGVAAAAIFGVLVIGRYLTRPILRIIAAANTREVFTAFALLLVIGIAQLMSLAGISTALGAFLAGVLLADSEFRHALQTDIEPFKGLLLGLFFISVGMSIDFGLLQSAPGHDRSAAGRTAGAEARHRVAGRPRDGRDRAAALAVRGAARAGRRVRVRRVRRRAHRRRPLRRMGGPIDHRRGAVDGDDPAAPPGSRQAARRAAAADERADDAIEADGSPVIIAGFGRFGQIVGRLLLAAGVRAIVLDHDPEQIEILRKFGYQVFYGDATRLDLLRAAGAANARLLVNAIDDIGDSVALTERVREHFPDLPIVARARNVSHYVALRTRGVTVVERETFEGALRTGRHVLETLGVDRFRAREMADTFRRHNVTTMEALIPHFSDEAKTLSESKAGREELREFFARDRAHFETEHRGGWNRD